ncbi:MAG: hypothetical protein ACHQK9_05015 [Reyranellales bacterium]
MRQYKNFDYSKSYPAGLKLFYECGLCGDVLPSWPRDSVHCKCRNIMIDADYGRVSIRDHAQVKLFTEDE